MKKIEFLLIISFVTVVLNQEQVLHPETFGSALETWLVLTKIWGRDATSIQLIQDWDASNHPTMHRTNTLLQQRIIRFKYY